MLTGNPEVRVSSARVFALLPARIRRCVADALPPALTEYGLSISLGPSQADADIRAFYEAREKLLRAQQAARGSDG